MATTPTDSTRNDAVDSSSSDSNGRSTTVESSICSSSGVENAPTPNADTSTPPLVAAPSTHNPFDPRMSHREPFPSFDDALAVRDEHDSERHGDASALLDASSSSVTDAHGNSNSSVTTPVHLDWSIDTIAEMRPMAFSPLPEQVQASRRADADDSREQLTPSSAAAHTRFFDDETQYRVLQTPSPLIRQQQQQHQQQQAAAQCDETSSQAQTAASPATPQRMFVTSRLTLSTPLTTTTPPLRAWRSAPRDLHSRCQDAIAFFADRLRERQRKLSRLQLPQTNSSAATPPPPLSASTRNKRRYCTDSEFPWTTTASSERKGIHPRASTSACSQRQQQQQRATTEPFRSPFTVPLTPISRSTSMATPTLARTAPASAASAGSTMPRELSFAFDGDSPIARRRSLTGDLSGVATPSFESPAPAGAAVSKYDGSGSGSDEHDKENNSRRRQERSSMDDETSSSSLLPVPSEWSRAAENGLSLKTLAMLQHSGTSQPQSQSQSQPPLSPSIAQRQVSFMAAIEASAASASGTESPRE